MNYVIRGTTKLCRTMDCKWKRAVELACVKLLVELDVLDNLDLPYAIPYMNYVMSWKNHLPIKTIIIGQNPYPQDIYPYMGAALSYDPDRIDSPPRSVRALCEDIYTYNETPMSKTVECIRDSWHLINNGTIMINETVFSMIYPRLKSNCRPTREMEAQCIALQSVVSASYFLGQEEFTVVGMGESAALMMDQLKKWCPSDVIKMKCVGCRNPAARERGDLPSRAFTLNHTAASKVVAAEIAWYHTMPPKKDNRLVRLDETRKSLEQSLLDLNVSKNTGRKEVDAFSERMKELEEDPGFAPYAAKLREPTNGVKKCMVSYTNAVKSHQMQFTQYVNAAMEAVKVGGTTSEVGITPIHRDISKLAKSNPPRTKLPMTVEAVDVHSTPNITKELKESSAKKIKDTPLNKKLNVTSTIAESDIASTVGTPSKAPNVSGSVPDTPTRKKKGLRNVSPEETSHVTAFANWFRNNMDDQVYAGMLQTMAEDKTVGDSTITTKVIRHIRNRKKEDSAYDAHPELEDKESTSYTWAMQLKNDLLESK
jgi:uracil DNA glycosylase